LDFLNNNEFT